MDHMGTTHTHTNIRLIPTRLLLCGRVGRAVHHLHRGLQAAAGLAGTIVSRRLRIMAAIRVTLVVTAMQAPLPLIRGVPNSMLAHLPLIKGVLVSGPRLLLGLLGRQRQGQGPPPRT